MSKNRYKETCDECGAEYWVKPAPPIDKSKLTEGEIYVYDTLLGSLYDMAMQPPVLSVPKKR